MKPPRKWDMVRIEWLDAVGHPDEHWNEKDTRLKREDSHHVTTGFYLDNDGKMTHVCRSYRPLDKNMDGIFAIPTGCIESIHILRVRVSKK